MSHPPTVKAGVQFAANFRGEVVAFKVIGKQGRDGWRAKIVGEVDEAGTERLFLQEEIEASLAIAARGLEIRRAHEAWFASRTTGEIVHYHNGSGQYVRARVVEGDGDAHPLLMPLALVGAWKPSSTTDYHLRAIEEKRPWQPHYTTCFEAGREGGRHGDFDPRTADTYSNGG